MKFLLLFIIIILLTVYYLSRDKTIETFGNISNNINEQINKIKRNTRHYSDSFIGTANENIKRRLRLHNLGVW